jgi:hypothetical protein
VLQNGVAITGLAGGAGSDQYFAIDIPSGLHETDFTISSGTGDADIYVAQDSLPTDSDFVCGSSDVANLDSCLLFDVTGRWYVRVHGTSAFSDLVLRVTSTSATRMLNLSLPGWSGAVGSQQYFWMRVDPGAKSVKFAFSHQKGDADLYGRYGSLPSQFVDVCKPPKHGRHSESCSIKKPAPGIWYFALFGATDFTDLTIKAKVNY